MEEIKLDLKDRKILYQLEKNCRQPVSLIAKEVGLSREVVDYRIRQLENKRVIESYITIVDYVKLGFVFYRIWFKYLNVSQKTENKMLEYASKIKSINWLLIGDGLFNMAIVFLVKDIITLEKELDNFRYLFGKHISSITPSIALQIYHFKHSYLYKNEDREPIVVGGSKAEIIDEQDMALLGELVKSPRIGVVNLSNKMKLSVKTISKKIDRLQKKEILKQFKIKINTNLLGYEHQKILLYLSNLNSEKINEIMTFLRYDSRVIFITKPFGKADLEFEIIVQGKRELFEFMRKLSSKFPSIIKDYDACLTYSEPLIRYLN